MAVVPNLFGTCDCFRGRQFFHGRGRGGMVQAVMQAMGSGRWSFARSPAAYLLLCDPVPNRPVPVHGPRVEYPDLWCSFSGTDLLYSISILLVVNGEVKKKNFLKILNLKWSSWASLVAQWLRVCLPRQGTRVRALVWEDPACRGAVGRVSHNYWACASGACALQRKADIERPAHREEEWPLLAATGESPRTETKTQHSQT